MAAIAGTANDDFLEGTAEIDTISGLGGNDTLRGLDGDDTLEGGEGGDVLIGGNGVDNVIGGPGDDRVQGTGGDRTTFVGRFGVGKATEFVDGGDGIDTLIIDYQNFVFEDGKPLPVRVDISTGAGVVGVLRLKGEAFINIERLEFYGPDGNNTVNGGGLADYLQGGAGRDNLTGGDGDDTVVDSGGFLLADGGGGTDALHLFRDAATGPVIFKAASGVMRIAGTVDARFSGFEMFRAAGGAGNDLFKFLKAGGTDLVSGGAGNDRIWGFAGNDEIFGDDGDDVLNGGDGDDAIHGGAGDNAILGGAGNDVLFSTGGADRMSGGGGDDILSLDGALVAPGAVVAGGAGDDLLELELRGNTTVDLTGVAIGGIEKLWDGFFTFATYEIVMNSADFSGLAEIRFDADAGIRLADNGDAVLPGWVGARRLFLSQDGQRLDASGYVFGILQVFGGAGDDTVTGADGTRRLVIDLGGGDDRFVGGGAADGVAGGDGFDTADYSRSAEAITLDLATGAAGIGGLAAGDTLSGFERVIGGGSNDRLTGGAAAETFAGGGGRDVLAGGDGRDDLDGGAGRDLLAGGRGNDRLTGGSGPDAFLFRGAIGRDIVTDFDPGADLLRLDDALWTGTLTERQVVQTFAAVVGGDTIFDFGGGRGFTLAGIASLDGLDAAVVLI